jgi:hypothetical protein
MAIEDVIAQGVTPPKVDTPQEYQTKQLMLSNLAQQNQAGAQQLQAGALDLQQKQLEARDNELVRQNYIKAAGDMDAFQKLNMSSGVSAKIQQGIAMQQLAIRKERATIGKDELANTGTRHQQAAGELAALAKDPGFQGKVKPTLDRLVQQGTLTPDEAAQMPANPTIDDINLARAHLLTSAEANKEALDNATAARNAAEGVKATDANARDAALQPFKLDEAKTTAATKARTDAAAQLATATSPEQYAQVLNGLPHGVATQFPPAEKFDPATTPGIVRQLGMSPDQQATTTQAATNAAETKRHNAQDERTATGRLSVEQQNSKRAQAQFDATYGALNGPDGKPLDPEAAKRVAEQDPTAVGIANYQLPPASTGGRGAGQPLMRKVMALNPQYDAKDWQNKGAVLKDFSTGKSSQELGAVSVALGHAAIMNQAVDALNNGDIRLMNAVANRIGVETGSSPAAVFKTIVHRVGPELTKAYIASGGGQGERGTTEADFDPNLSPKVLKDNIAISAKLLDGKIDQKQQQWKNVMGDRPFPGLTPAAIEARKTLVGGSPTKPKTEAATATVKDPRGVVHTFPTQAAADAFKKEVGIK